MRLRLRGCASLTSVACGLLFGQGGHFLVADTTPLGLKGLECAKLLLTHAKVSSCLDGCWAGDAVGRKGHGFTPLRLRLLPRPFPTQQDQPPP